MAMLSISKMVYIDTEVDVDLDDFSDEDLRAELDQRGLAPVEDGSVFHAIRDALKLDNHVLALNLTRAAICEMFGCVL